ncbi:hypothetical protein TRVA0_010S00540 [Trichomonascus vanleenenianus]|uniref:Whi5 domain-containing protein n=1 Tax=Trichomonascus vanleenenianus TaxID=2268995 RepID=UPI003ECA583A
MDKSNILRMDKEIMGMDISSQAKAKILRRAAVSKLARTLRSRLQLASLKCQRGWRELSFDDVVRKMQLPPNNTTTNTPNNYTGKYYYQVAHSSQQPTLYSVPPLYGETLPSIASLQLPPSPIRRNRKRSFVSNDESLQGRYTKARGNNGEEQEDVWRSSPLAGLKRHRALATPPPSTPPQQEKEEEEPPRTPENNRGADLLMYLATSPSKAGPHRIHTTPGEESSTQLFTVRSSPVAYMPTPGKNGFSLSEYISMSPSPTKRT